jgi:hypothetical protein
MHLSKSDFKVARTCGTKLYYKKLRYPSKQDDDPYLEFLADGGYMVETIAKLLFPEGNLITAPPDWVGENAPDAIVAFFSDTITSRTQWNWTGQSGITLRNAQLLKSWR